VLHQRPCQEDPWQGQFFRLNIYLQGRADVFTEAGELARELFGFAFSP
jgi:hypothetical protein